MYYETACPRCDAPAIISHNYARKVGGFIGALAGAATGLTGTKGSSSLAVLAGTLMAVLVGATAGCSTGTILGASIDENVLNNFECAHCGSRFSRQQGDMAHHHMPEYWQS